MMGGGYNFGQDRGSSGLWIVVAVAVAVFGGIAFAVWIGQYP